MAFKVQYLLLADHVQDVKNGKINILGTFGRLRPKEVPFQHPGFAVVAQLVAQNEDDLHEHQLACQLLRPNGQIALQVGGVLNLPPNRDVGPLAAARIVLGLQNVPIREYGTHRVLLLVDGDEIADHPLYVSAPAASQK